MKPYLPPICAAVVSACISLPLWAAPGFEPEVFTVEKEIKPGPNVYVNYASWDGSSKLHVYGQDGLEYKGLMGMGLTSQFILSSDGKTAFTLSDYMKRYTTGPIESVLQIYDVATLTALNEIVIPNKAVKAIGMTQLIDISADNKWVYVQNATPATSVTVVDVLAGKVISEVPNPGCYGIIAAEKDKKFSTICGTGELKTYVLDGDSYKVDTATIFDLDNDPVYLHTQRRKNGDLIFTSFNGNLYLVDDSGKSAKLKKTLPVTKGISGNWAPGGYEITAYNKAHDVVFMLMHGDAYEGSHKDGSAEIWAYSLDKGQLISRSPAPHLVALSATHDKNPKLYGANEEDESVDEYTLGDKKAFNFELTASDDRAGWSTMLMVSPE